MSRARRFKHCADVGGIAQLFWDLDDETAPSPKVHVLAQTNATAAAGYFAVGFGNTAGKMVPASVVAAVGSAVHDYRLTGYGATNTGPGNMNLTSTSVAVADGTMTLRFSRPLVCADKTVEPIEPGTKTNLIVAIKKTPGYGYHDNMAAVAISLQTGKTAKIATQIPWRSIHAYSMMAMWGVAAPAAILITRFGRYSNPNDLPKGAAVGALKPAAYKWHLALQVCVVIVTVASCAIGLFKIGGGGGPSTHKILGIVVTAIAGVQFVLGALCRPKPDADMRWMWNFFHHWLGRAAVVCAWCDEFPPLPPPPPPLLLLLLLLLLLRLYCSHDSARDLPCVLPNLCAQGEFLLRSAHVQPTGSARRFQQFIHHCQLGCCIRPSANHRHYLPRYATYILHGARC